MKIKSVYIFEDDKVRNLHPLTYLRPVFDLRCGILTLREKLEKYFNTNNIKLLCRDYLIDYVKGQNPNVLVNEIVPEDCIFINGRVIANKELIKNIINSKDEAVFVKGYDLVAVKAKTNSLKNFSYTGNITVSQFKNLKKIDIEANLINYPWDLVSYNGTEIVSDYKLLVHNKKQNKHNYPDAYLLNPENIFIDERSVLKPGVVIDAEDGPIFIGKNVTILPNAVIQGPAYIGNNSIIKMHAKIYHNTSIGETCKIGGEVEESIFHSFSNKQHEGYIGHSYVASWVNFGADTNNSDLKNNYGNIKTYINGKLVDTGLQFVGLTMGDHSKTAINTMFNTGTVVGISCNIFGAGFPPVYIPSFSWGGSESMKTFGLDKSIEVAKIVMSRRNKSLTPIEENLFRSVYEMTTQEREHRIRQIK